MEIADHFHFSALKILRMTLNVKLVLLIILCSDCQIKYGASYGGIGDGWMTCNFTFFPTAFQSYRDVGRVILKWGFVYN